MTTGDRRRDDVRVGVVIPLFNRADIIPGTLQSVIEQEFQPARLVIVDDGSADGSADVAERWLKARRPDFEWIVIRAPHRHAAAARNRGLAEVSELPLVAFLDSDDCWPADFLLRCGAALAARPAAVAASTDRDIDGPDRRYVNSDLRAISDDPALWLVRNDAGIASCTVLRSAAVSAVGGWKDGLSAGEDFLLFTAIGRQGRWLHVPGEPVRFNRNTGQAKGQQVNLSRSQPIKHWQWAELAEQEFEAHPGTGERREAMRQAVARRWGSAGNHLLRKRMFGKAHAAYLRSAALSGPSPGLRLRLWGSRVLSLAGGH
jgi:glycosyltransferase involved in cell wall biosynthesis